MSEILSVVNDGITREIIRRATEILRKGGTILYPTETIYGLGCDARSGEAVRKVFALKRRTETKPVLMIVPDHAMVESLVLEIPSAARVLMDHFWPGPLTIVFRAIPDLDPLLTGGTGMVAMRIPSSPFCLQLLRSCRTPLVSTSANIADGPVPGGMAGFRKLFGDGIDLYIDGGILPPSPPSTVVDVVGGEVTVLREGAVSVTAIRNIVSGIA